MRRLTEDDLERLEAFLMSLGEEAMTLNELHGYLTGIIVCPEMILPKEWLGRSGAAERPSKALKRPTKC